MRRCSTKKRNLLFHHQKLTMLSIACRVANVKCHLYRDDIDKATGVGSDSRDCNLHKRWELIVPLHHHLPHSSSPFCLSLLQLIFNSIGTYLWDNNIQASKFLLFLKYRRNLSFKSTKIIEKQIDGFLHIIVAHVSQFFNFFCAIDCIPNITLKLNKSIIRLND